MLNTITIRLDLRALAHEHAFVEDGTAKGFEVLERVRLAAAGREVLPEVDADAGQLAVAGCNRHIRLFVPIDIQRRHVDITPMGN